MDEMILTPAEKMERVVERLTRERDEALAFLRRASVGPREIVSTGRLTELEIANYRTAGLMYVEPGGGLGWVVRERRVLEMAEKERDEAEVARLEGLILSVARVIRGRDGLPCWCDDYDARPDHTHSAKCIEARRIRAKREKGEARTTCRHGVQWPDFCQFNCAIGKPAQREKEK